MTETGCGFQRAEDMHDPEWFCVVHQCWSSTPDLCPLQRAEAQIAAVREAVERHERIYAPSDAEGIPVQVILRALDGGSDE